MGKGENDAGKQKMWGEKAPSFTDRAWLKFVGEKTSRFLAGSFSYTSYADMKCEGSAFPEPFLSLDTVSSADSGSCLENSSDCDHLT